MCPQQAASETSNKPEGKAVENQRRKRTPASNNSEELCVQACHKSGMLGGKRMQHPEKNKSLVHDCC
jgi:hypothetical protein